MEYFDDFGSSMSQHSRIGQQGDIFRAAEFSLARETVSELGDHQLFDERLAPGYNHQTFDKTEQMSDTMSNHTYPQQDHACHYHQFAHPSPYPPSYYHPSPYFSPYFLQHPHPNYFTQTLYPHSALPPTTYPPYQELSMNYSALPFDQGACVSTFPSWHPQLLVQQEGTAEHAPLLFHSRPTETVQPCAIQGASAVDMGCQQVPRDHATSTETDCLTKNEQQSHHGIETQSISDMLDNIQAQLKTMSENLSQNLKRMKSGESKQSVSTQVADVAPVCCSKANNTASSETMLVHNLQLPVTVQMPIYDVYDEDTNVFLHGVVELCDTVGQHKQFDSDKHGATNLSSGTSDNKLLAVSFNNASDNAFSEEATDFTFPHGPVIHAERFTKITNKKNTQAVSILCGQEATVHCDDEIFEIYSKKQDVLINKHAISDNKPYVSFPKPGISPRQHHCDLNNDKEELLWDLASVRSTTRCSKSSLKFGVCEVYPILPCIWDPGIDRFSYKNQHLFHWVQRSPILILQQLHIKNISCLLEFSLEKGRQVQWDPGIKLLLYELLWLKTVSKETEYALRHFLAVIFGTHDSIYFIDTAATMCSPANLIQQGRNFAAVLHFWLSIFSDMHCCRIFLKYNAMSSQLLRNQDMKFNIIALWLITFNPP